MYKKVFYSILFFLLPGLVLPSTVRAADPNLIGWWKFDEGSGTTAQDSSGLGNHGTITNAQWVAGFVDGALNFNAVGYVDVPAKAWSTIQKQLTVAFWAYGDPPRQPQNHFAFAAFQDPAVGDSRVASCHVPWGNGTVYFDTGGTAPASGYDRINKAATPGEYEGRWQHWAFTKSATTGQQRIYLNGVLWHSGTGLTRTMGGAGVTAFTIGCGPGHTQFYAGMIDDFRIYDRVLTEGELKVLAARPKAYDPDPADGAEGVITPMFRWTAGTFAMRHNFYLGTAPDALEFMGPQPYPVYWHVPGLVPDTTYYWRVDEVEADLVTIHTGDVWSFTAAPLAAYDPDPPDGARYVSTDADFSWSPGATAITHDVYLGTDETAVRDGTGDTFKVNQPLTTYDPGTLAENATYYWRIDEVEQGGAKHKGDVWSFSTEVVPITDPNLIAWWKLDAGFGRTAFDWSGYNHHATIGGTPDFVPGYDGEALDFDGSTDYIDVDGRLVTGTFTLTMWICPRDIPYSSGYYAVLHNDAWDAGSVHVHLRANTSLLNADINTGPGVTGTTALQANEWYHFAVTVTTAGGNASKLYVNGVLEGTGSGGTGTPYLGPMIIGAWENGTSRHYHGLMDDIRIYDKLLTAAEIPQTMRGDPMLAWKPSPANRYTPDVDAATPLTWKPGDKAAQHDVYFGTDETAVADATTASAGIYRGRQVATSYNPPEPLVWGQTYYWRIDEYNTDGTLSKGRVWTFTVANYLIPDDFEDYDDWCNRVFYTWTDGWGYSADPACGVVASGGNGTGSTVGNLNPPFAEQTIVHSGGQQSMPFEYDNSGAAGKARYSETQRQWASPQDWTRNNVKALTLWFYGAPANTVEQLYVAVEDNAGQVKVVNHPEPEALQIAVWQEWNIELTQFTGVNLKAVKKLYIGLGNRASPTAGGSGKLYIDDIRVYPSRCVPSKPKPAADLNNNCIVDYPDVELLTNRWLDTGFLVTPADPGTSGLIAHYPFEGNANDIVGGQNGTTTGLPVYATGKIGQAIELDGVDDYVDCGAGTVFNISTNITVACWIKVWQFDKTWQAIVTKGDSSWRLHRSGTSNNISWGTTGLTPLDLTGSVNVNDGQWHHVGAVYNGTQKRLYVDGNLDASAASTGTISTNTYNVNIGENAQATGRYWTGLIDDVRIYSRALSQAEIASLAGRSSTFSIPADLHMDDKIDLKDFAVLADSWLEELLWP